MLRLPIELVILIIDLEVRDDLDAVLIYQVCIQLRDLIGDRQRLNQPYPRRLFYCLKTDKIPITTPMLDWYWKQRAIWTDSLMDRMGRYATCDMLSRIPLSSLLIQGAVEMGRLDFLKEIWKAEDRLQPEDDLMECAILANHFEIAKWLREVKHCEFDSYSLSYAASTGNLEMVEWILEENPLSETQNVIQSAAGGGHLELLKWLLSHDYPVSRGTLNAAAGKGHLEVVRWLIDNNIQRPTIYAMSMAAYGGHLEVIKYLREKDCLWDYYVIDSAAELGFLQIVVWLVENSCRELRPSAIYRAASRGHLDIIKYLHSKGCPIDQDAMYNAVEGGHFDVMKWLHTHTSPGIQYEEEALLTVCAVESGNLTIVIWLFENGYIKPDCGAAVNHAAYKGHLHIIIWLREHGYPWRMNGLRNAVVGDHIEIARWMWEQGYRPGDAAKFSSLEAYARAQDMDSIDEDL